MTMSLPLPVRERAITLRLGFGLPLKSGTAPAGRRTPTSALCTTATRQRSERDPPGRIMPAPHAGSRAHRRALIERTINASALR